MFVGLVAHVHCICFRGVCDIDAVRCGPAHVVCVGIWIGFELLWFFLQIVPAASNGADAVNFRRMHESSSLQLEGQQQQTAGTKTREGEQGGRGDTEERDLFGAFSSVTLKYDGDEP